MAADSIKITDFANASDILEQRSVEKPHVELQAAGAEMFDNNGIELTSVTDNEASKSKRIIPDGLPKYLNHPGVAPVKFEFVKPLNNMFLECEDSETAEEIADENKTEETDDSKEEELSGPPRKKKRGQNKKRPHRNRPDPCTRFCPNLLHKKECNFGEKCIFTHDAAKFMENKPADIGGNCVLFDLFGKCPYGLTCRFGKSHISADFENIINEEKYNPEKRSTTTNVLEKELQFSLRKNKVKFPKSEQFLRVMNKLNKEGKELSELSELLKPTQELQTSGVVTDEDQVKLRPQEKKQIDFSDKLFLAPLTTVGNLPFRRICKTFGADITCGEMAMSTNLLQGQQSEWALLKRHVSEDLFGVQICGSFPDSVTRCAEMLQENVDVDFIDLNVGCPIDLVFKKGGGSALMGRLSKFEQIVRGMLHVINVPLTVKMRAGIEEKKPFNAHKIIPKLREWGVSLTTVHGRSRQQRYSKHANWDYINECAKAAHPMPLFGNGDVLSYEDANLRRKSTGVSGLMIARGALIKPWIFSEIKEERNWDISSKERFNILQNFVNNGLEHWGADQQGVEITRRFLLEWLSFLCRYIPVGVLEYLPQKINDRPPPFFGRDEMESLMASTDCKDWIKISEMLLGPVPDNFQFLPKHKANSYS